MPLDAVPIWGLFILTLLAIALAQECGYRVGQARGRRSGKEHDAPVGGMVAAELGLLAFLLAFTFGFAAARFEDRRQVVLDESNAIGTTYLRTAMLQEPQRVEARRLLREYVDVRIAAATQRTPMEEALRKSEDLHRLLWAEAVAAAGQDPRSVQTGLFVQSLNEVIDLHAKRVLAGLRSRIPTPVWVVLAGVALMAFLAVGYQVGLTRTSRSPAVWVVALTFAAVIVLIADLDRPGEGVLQVSQQPMIDLRNSMDAP